MDDPTSDADMETGRKLHGCGSPELGCRDCNNIFEALRDAREQGYDAGAADVEARIDAAIAKHYAEPPTRAEFVAYLRQHAHTTHERVLLGILDPETKP
jgi:hypothetical protein